MNVCKHCIITFVNLYYIYVWDNERRLSRLNKYCKIWRTWAKGSNCIISTRFLMS